MGGKIYTLCGPNSRPYPISDLQGFVILSRHFNYDCFNCVSFQKELSQVKRRNKQLCFILSQAESKWTLWAMMILNRHLSDNHYQLFSVKEKSELLMQIEELNEVKEQVRVNSISSLLNFLQTSFKFILKTSVNNFSPGCTVTCWVGAGKIKKFCLEKWIGKGRN